MTSERIKINFEDYEYILHISFIHLCRLYRGPPSCRCQRRNPPPQKIHHSFSPKLRLRHLRNLAFCFLPAHRLQRRLASRSFTRIRRFSQCIQYKTKQLPPPAAYEHALDMSSLEPRRPRLLAQNRKLRHLKGLSLRNLSFDPPHLQTADDAYVADSSPRKLEVLREAGSLHPSRSSETLRQDSLRVGKNVARPQQTRRVSLGSAFATPAVRQKKLEEVLDAAVGDVFFSLHVAAHDEPMYISEVRHKSAVSEPANSRTGVTNGALQNFNFQFFNLEISSPDISRSPILYIRIWSRRPKQDSWVFLLEELIDLRKLNFIGTMVGRHFPPNSLLFHLEDGLYSLDFATNAAAPRDATPIGTSSYNALMKLANLEHSIDDAINTQKMITQQINEILEDSAVDGSGAAQEEQALADKYVQAQIRVNNQAERRRNELRESLQRRRKAIEEGRQAQQRAEDDIADNRAKLETSKQQVATLDRDIRGQRRRICSELNRIFPITPIPDSPPLSFEICGIPLSNSVYDAATARAYGEEALSSGLGLVALVTHNLQYYLSHPLPYPITHFGSQSFITDEISHLADKNVGRRQFPLFLPRGGSTSGQWRFEYGWFLLNKDIEALCASQGLRVVDIRHTLANLKFLLYVCSAGTEELPERKKGGVRGLWSGQLKSRVSAIPAGLKDKETASIASSSNSRPGSADSQAAHGQPGDALRAEALSGGNGSLRWSPAAEETVLGLPFDESDTTFTLRTKGLRENVAG